MADGDLIDHIIARDTVETTDANATTLVSIDLADYSADNYMFYLRGWCQGYRVDTDSTDGYVGEQWAYGKNDADESSFVINHYGDVVSGGLDPEATAYTMGLSISGTSVQLQVAGQSSQTVRWQGRLTIELTEVDFPAPS